MNLDGLLGLITESKTDDWSPISRGPTFRDRFIQVSSGDKDWIEIKSHHTVAVYKPDIAITLGFGMEWVKDFEEPWAKNFPDPHAEGSYIDVYYYGALVYRNLYITVDGGRAHLPLPKSRNELIVSQQYNNLIRLINSIGAISLYDEYFKRAGFQIGDAE